MKIAAIICSVAILSGCIVAPAPYVYAQEETCYVNGVQVACYNPNTVVYPVYEEAYIWDPVLGCFFFWGGGYRHYMDHGWAYGRGVPHGYFHGHREGGGFRGSEGHHGHR